MLTNPNFRIAFVSSSNIYLQKERCHLKPSYCPGFEQKEECDEWPVQKCTLSTANVEKHSPWTECDKVNDTLCAPRGCGHKEVRCEEIIYNIL